eukprot:7140167-Lingulodinium_polyedra.AAC.1
MLSMSRFAKKVDGAQPPVARLSLKLSLVANLWDVFLATVACHPSSNAPRAARSKPYCTAGAA